MIFDFVTNLQTCFDAVQQNSTLVYYAHLPTVILSLFVGVYVLFKGENRLLGKILFSLTIVFSLWSLSDLIVWTNYNSIVIMFFWSVLSIIELSFFVLSFYFVYLFIEKKDISLKVKIIFFLLLLPILLLASTNINLNSFSYETCEAVPGELFLNMLFYLEIGISVAIILFCIAKYIFATKEMKRQIAVLMFGVSVFLLSFFLAGYLADYYENYDIELYGLFGIVIFIGTLAYLIVKYNVMNIKLAQAQALVWALILLIGSQFFFIQSSVNMVLNGITFIGVCIFGYNLVKSVKKETEQKEKLEHMTKELARANIELKKLDSAKSEFISIASHQLRTPLTAIKGYISLILEGAYGQNAERTDDALNKIFLANERLIQLVEDMLNLTRIESGRLEYHIEDNVQIEDIINELRDMFILRTQDKKLDFIIALPDGQLPAISADKSKLREVVSNIIDNAIKYTKEGFVRVSAEAIGDIVRVTVEDSGMGISEESLKTLFAKFSRGTDSTKAYTDGSGLGLYVGKNLVESQGGHIYVESDGVGKGSRFIIEMPIHKK